MDDDDRNIPVKISGPVPPRRSPQPVAKRVEVFRCLACGYKFVGERELCPACGAGRPAHKPHTYITHLVQAPPSPPKLSRVELRIFVARREADED